MNIIAIDVGNTNITIGLFLEGKERSIESIPGDSDEEIRSLIRNHWELIPVLESSKEGKRDGVIVVSSVKDKWTRKIKQIVNDELSENIYRIPNDVPYPIELAIENRETVGTDRIIAAAAAYTVVEDAVVVADFGTAITIDLVDDRGIFAGGCILPGFEMSAKALHEDTAQLPQIEIHKPQWPFGKNTAEAINSGLYYGAIATLQEVVRRYAETLGTWPQVIMTGKGAAIIAEDCDFVDDYVPNLVVKGIALAYTHHAQRKR